MRNIYFQMGRLHHKLALLVHLASHLSSKGSSYLFTEYKYPVDPGAGHRNRAEYARQYGPVMN